MKLYVAALTKGKTNNMVALFRKFNNVVNRSEIDDVSFFDTDEFSQKLSDDFENYVVSMMEERNCLRLATQWEDGGIDPELEDHETYLSRFRSFVKEHVKYLTNQHKEHEPELVSRKKIVQVSPCRKRNPKFREFVIILPITVFRFY